MCATTRQFFLHKAFDASRCSWRGAAGRCNGRVILLELRNDQLLTGGVQCFSGGHAGLADCAWVPSCRSSMYAAVGCCCIPLVDTAEQPLVPVEHCCILVCVNNIRNRLLRGPRMVANAANGTRSRTASTVGACSKREPLAHP